jgi:hypothetical protein
MDWQKFSLAEAPILAEQFTTLDTVTISIADLSDDSVVALDTNSCTEVTTSGVFKFPLSNITTYPTTPVEYVYIMTNGATTKSGKITLYAQEGSVNGANQTTITVNDSVPAPIVSVEVQVWNSGQTVLLDTKTTNASGQVVFALDDGSYKVVLSKPQYSFTVPEDLTVSGVTTDTYTGNAIVITPGSGAGECEVSIFSASQRPTVNLANLEGTAQIVNLPAELSGIYYPGQKISGTYVSTSPARLYWILPQGATVSFKCDTLGISAEKAIPATSSADYKDL